MEMDTIIDNWKQNAQRHDDRNFMFLRSLKMKDDRVVDRKAHRLHREAFSIIDCTQCANCCKTIHPLLTEEDIQRIARHLGMDESAFQAEYLEADEDGGFKMKDLPCSFLGADNRCKIYEVRPANCVEYPYTDKEGFTFRTYGIADNSLVCPAVFYIIEEMRAGGLRHRS
jgi:Fe-S-cluster containining protein